MVLRCHSPSLRASNVTPVLFCFLDLYKDSFDLYNTCLDFVHLAIPVSIKPVFVAK